MKMIKQPIYVGNAGTEIAATNYFDSEHARNGFFYISWNASTARILVPDCCRSEIYEMCTGRICVISRGKFRGADALELMFDDDSDSPFAIHIGMQNVDREVRNDNAEFKVAAWTRQGKVAEWEGKYRVVKKLPYMAPWTKRK